MSQPPTLNYQSANDNRAGLRAIASRQRAIMICILVYLVLVVCVFVVPKELAPILSIAGLGASIANFVFIFRLATKVYGIALGIVLGILVIVPLLGLLILLMVNGKATTILKSHGIKVGLLGADPDTIR